MVDKGSSPRWTLARVLGRGTDSTVWEASGASGTTAAVKVLGPAQAEGARERLRREHAVLERCRHPHLVRTLGLADAADLVMPGGQAPAEGPALVLEHVAGPSLADARLSRDQALAAWSQVAHALEALHGHGFVHRDLKPENVLLRETPEPGRPPEAVLCDLGAAATAGSDARPAGSLAYLAPETIWGAPPRPEADVHGLGGLLFFLVTGRAPWSGRDAAEALEARRHSAPPLPDDVEVPSDLAAVLGDLLAPAAAARPPGPLAAVRLLNRQAGTAFPEEPGHLAPRPGLAPWMGRTAAMARVDEILAERETPTPPMRWVVVRAEDGAGKSRFLEEVETRARLRGLPTFRDVPEEPAADAVVLLDDRDPAAVPPPAAGAWFVAGTPDAELPAGATELALDPLSERECLDLAAGVLGLAPLREGDAAELRAASGGLPGRLEHLVASLVEAGGLQVAGGELRVAPDALRQSSDAVGIVRARLAGVSADAALLVHLASLLERPVTAAVLARVAGLPEGDDRVSAAAAELLDSGLLRITAETERGAELEAPSPVRAAALAGLSAARARMMRLRAATVLAGAGDDFTGVRARLLDDAGRPEEAAPLHAAAGRRALQEGRPDRALGHLRRASELRPPGSAPDAELGVCLARALASSGRAAEAVAEIDAALPHLADDARRAEALELAAEAASRAGREEAAEEACRAARRLFRRQGSARGHAACTSRLGQLAAARGDSRRARAAFRAALAVARREADDDLEARILNNLGDLLRREGRLDEAAHHLSAAHEVRRRLGDVHGAARALNNLGIVRGLGGRLDDAARAFERARAAFREAGDTTEEARALNNAGMASWQAGRLAAADEALASAERAFEAVGDERGATDVRRNRSLLALDRGRLGEAKALALACTEAREDAGTFLDAADVLRVVGDHPAAVALRERATSLDPAGRLAILGRVGAELDRALRGEALGEPLPEPPRDLAAWPFDEAVRWRLEAGRLAECRGHHDTARALAAEARGAGAEGAARRERLEAASLLAGPRPAGEALDLLAEELAALVPGTHPEVAWRARLRLARGLASTGRPGAAAAQAELAREALAQLADSLEGPDRESFLAAEGRELALSELGSLAGAAVAAEGAPGGAAVAPALLDLVRLLNENLDADRLLPRVVDFAIELAGADRGCLILFDEGLDAPRIARDRDGKDVPPGRFQHSRSIVERVRASGEPVVIDSFAESETPLSASIHDLRLGSATCVPLPPPAGVAGGLLGALYVDSLVQRAGFGEREVELLRALAAHAGVAIVNAQLLARIRAEKDALASEVERLRHASDGDEAFGEALGRSPSMREIFELLERVAPSEASILIEGESGTGKEVLARAIHARSQRAEGPFVAVDCGSLPESLIESELFGHRKGAFTGADRDRAGLFEQARGGTLFLDEIAGTSAGVQAKLLRVLQEREVRRVGDDRPRPVDVRVVAASNRPLPDEVAAGRFREDLLFRLNVVSLRLPPLRDRPEDVPLLARHFLERAAAREGRDVRSFEPAALSLLARAGWPGNVRELENVVARAVVMARGPTITVDDLPTSIAGRGPASSAPAPAAGASSAGVDLWHACVEEGRDPWEVVRDAFQAHDITRADVRALLHRGLEATGGSYKELTRRLGIDDADYKRFMDFLRQNRCRVDFRPYRAARRSGSAR